MRRNSWHIQLIQLLSVIGLLVAFYLWLYHNGDLIAVCSPSGWEDCGQVSGPDAPYSSIGSVSVALLGFIGYAIIFLLTWLRQSSAWVTENLPELLVGVIGLAFLFSLGLTGLELFVIHAFCRYCLVSAVLVTIMFGTAVAYLRQAENDNES